MQEQQSGDKYREHSKELEQAFSIFNEASTSLTRAYQHLEHQVENLSHELESTRLESAMKGEANEELSERLRVLVDVLPAGVVVLNSSGNVSEYNQCAKELLGEPLQGKKWENIVRDSFQPRWDDGHDISMKDGRCVNVSTKSLPEQQGQLVLLNEVTETKHLQRQLDRLKRTSAMGDFAASIAHQVRTPLSSALLYASNLHRNDLSEKLSNRFLDKLTQRLRHLERLIEDMLLFARGGGMNTKLLSVDTLFQELQENIENLLSSNNAELSIINNTEGIQLEVNKNTLHSIFQNLIENSIQACPENLEIKIHISKLSGDKVEILFSDNGPGINQEIQAHIFEPFYSTREGGTGLGLAIADAVIRSHQGTIKIQQSDSGAVFNIQLPVNLMHMSTVNSDAIISSRRGEAYV